MWWEKCDIVNDDDHVTLQGDDKKKEEDSDDEKEKEKEEELAALEGRKEKDTNKQMMKTGRCKMAVDQEDVKNNKEKGRNSL